MRPISCATATTVTRLGSEFRVSSLSQTAPCGDDETLLPDPHRRRGPRFQPEQLRRRLARHGPTNWAGLVDYFEPRRGRESRRLQQVLAGLVASGEVVRSRHGEYRLAAAAEEAQPALPADPVVAVLVRWGRGWCADSVDPAFDGRIDLSTPPAADAGAVVAVQLTTISARRAEGRVQRVIEGGNEAARAAEALLAAHRVPRQWPFDPARLGLPSAVSAADRAGRRDLRELALVTIDGADARDFDDAVYAAPVASGGWRLVVAIADVSHYVRPGTALDAAARERGNSLYLPDRVVPMLPEAISNHLCSLVPGEDRLSVACEMRISANGRIGGARFATAVIHSKARLTYAEVAAFLAGRPLPDAAASPAIAASLTALHGVYRALESRREARGALDFDSRETRLTLRAGQPTGVAPVARTDAHRLIEEAMIAANVAAARHLEREAKTKADEATAPPPLYRIHESPEPAKLATLSSALALAGERLPAGRPTPAALAAAAARARAKSSWPGWIWDAAVLRSLEQARYAPLRRGHFGLALPTYLHFTSPIRRYADLVVHRAIKGNTLTADELDAIGAHVSMTERRAETVERGVDAWLKCALASAHIGETREGVIAAVAAFGVFVELDGLFVQGLLHVSKLGRDYFHHVPAAMALVAERSGARFGVGERVTVTIEDVAAPAGRIDLALANVPGRSGRRRSPRQP